MSSRRGKPPGHFFCRRRRPTTGRDGPCFYPPPQPGTGSAAPRSVKPCPYAAAPGPLGPPAVSGAKRPAGGAAPVAVVPARPQRWRAGTKKVCGRSGAGRAGTGPARPPPPHRSGPALSGPGPGAPAAVGVGWWLAAGRPARGRPASGLVAGRLCAGGRSPPAGALCRGGGGPVAGCGRLGVGWAALPAPVPRLRLIRPPPAGAPPAARRRGGGGPLSGARPWSSLGWPRPPLGGPVAPRPRTLPNARARRHDAARATGVGVLPPAGGAPLRAAARRPPMRGGWDLDSAACGRRGTSTGRKGVCGKPGKGVLHDDDPHFSELFEVLKNVTASRKDFFDSLTQQGPAFSAGPCWVIKEGSLPAVPEEVEGKESGFTPEWPGRRRTRRRWHGRTSPAAPAR